MQLLIQCRPGFEPEAIQEVKERLLTPKGAFSVIENGEGFALLDVLAPRSLYSQIHWKEWIFVRQWWTVDQSIQFHPEERFEALLQAITEFSKSQKYPWLEICAEYPDSNNGRAITTHLQRILPMLEDALKPLFLDPAEVISEDSESTEKENRLALFFPDNKRCFIGNASPKSAPWPMGIPRLRFPAESPSRSTLKLAEAFEVFLSMREQEIFLKPGQTAVDLGAAPGGWTWQLVSHGMQVLAVDNGPLKGPVATHSAVTHLRVDGFKFRPKQAVDWLVCDMVEQPKRVSQLILDWFLTGFTRQAIFNLKLQPGKRLAEVQMCQKLILDGLAEAGVRGRMLSRQLYHDREEITVYLRNDGTIRDPKW